jgi:hypothetical protein
MRLAELCCETTRNCAKCAGMILAFYPSWQGHVCPITDRELTMTNRLLLTVSVLAVVTAGCTSFDRTSTLAAPTATGIAALMGSWTSATLIPPPSACSDFKWTVTEQTATAASGSFTASCAGDLKFTGTAQGNLLSPTNIGWVAQGNATGPGLTSCAIALVGTAEVLTDSIRVPYSGDTCLGKVSGIETLRKR